MRVRSFDDFEAFAGSVGDADSSMMLQNPKRHIWSINDVAVSGIHVQSGRLGSGNIVQGQAKAGIHLLYVPLGNHCKHVFNGVNVTQNACAIMEPGREFFLSIPSAHDWFSVAIPTEMFARGESAGSRFDSNKNTCRVSRENREYASRLRQCVRDVMTAATKCPQFESGAAARSAAATLARVSSLVLGQQLPTPSQLKGRPKIRRQDIIDRSLALVEIRDGEPVLLGELAAAAEVSERTIETAFYEYFGVGPIRYLQLRQLNRIHRALRAAVPAEVSVSNILVAHGVWEFGRFASRYRQLFGELPSETLRGG
jgi:AraC family ethanolamine operon transcriptional activator